MITLVLIVCLSGSPDVCKEVTAPAEVTLTECMLYAQPIASEMLKDMPKYTLKSWKCKVAVSLERGA